MKAGRLSTVVSRPPVLALEILTRSTSQSWRGARRARLSAAPSPYT